jgi:hypothetical protein
MQFSAPTLFHSHIKRNIVAFDVLLWQTKPSVYNLLVHMSYPIRLGLNALENFRPVLPQSVSCEL